MRTRDGRALIAVRDHYLSAEMMGINLTKYRTLVLWHIGVFRRDRRRALRALPAIRVGRGFTILFSIQFLGMIIIGGLGSISGTLMGTAFMVMLPEAMEWLTSSLAGGSIDRALGLKNQHLLSARDGDRPAIILFLIFEPDGLAHRWSQIKAYWKLYPFSH